GTAKKSGCGNDSGFQIRKSSAENRPVTGFARNRPTSTENPVRSSNFRVNKSSMENIYKSRPPNPKPQKHTNPSVTKTTDPSVATIRQTAAYGNSTLSPRRAIHVFPSVPSSPLNSTAPETTCTKRGCSFASN